MNTGRNENLRGTGIGGAAARNGTLLAALLLLGGCSRPGTSGSATTTTPTFANPQILQFRILASPKRDEAVCARAKRQQERETTLGRPWSAEVYRDPDAKQDLSARWYRCDPEFAQTAIGNPDMLVRRLPDSAGAGGIPNFPGTMVAQHEVLALADNYNINRVDFESIRTGLDESGAPCVVFAMTKDGATKLFNLTSMRLPTAGVFSSMAIIFDDRVISAPRLNDSITTHGQITGRFTLDEVNRLVDLCNVTHIAKPRPMPQPASLGTGFVSPTGTRPLPTSLGTGVVRPLPVFTPSPTGAPAATRPVATSTGTPAAKPSVTPTATPTGTPAAKPSGTSTGVTTGITSGISAGTPTATPSPTTVKRP
jgi:hypothetical protein